MQSLSDELINRTKRLHLALGFFCYCSCSCCRKSAVLVEVFCARFCRHWFNFFPPAMLPCTCSSSPLHFHVFYFYALSLNFSVTWNPPCPLFFANVLMNSSKADCAVLNTRPYEILKHKDYKMDAHICLTGPFVRHMWCSFLWWLVWGVSSSLSTSSGFSAALLCLTSRHKTILPTWWCFPTSWKGLYLGMVKSGTFGKRGWVRHTFSRWREKLSPSLFPLSLYGLFCGPCNFCSITLPRT